MNKKLIAILGIIAIAAIGGTIAFFNDTETSEGNIFIAGTIDLKVDNSAYYNGYKCNEETEKWECEPWADYVVSYISGSAITAPDRMDPTQALGLALDSTGGPIDFVSLGVHGFGFEQGGEIVLGFDNYILSDDNVNTPDLEVIETTWGGGANICNLYPEHATVSVSLTGNDETWVILGDICQDGQLDMDSKGITKAKYVKIVDNSVAYSDLSYMSYDVNGVRALHCGVAQPIMLTQDCENSWDITNLDGHHFFSIDDLKPGDHGKDIISLHVESNDAYACLEIKNKVNLENVCIDPEISAGDNPASEIGEIGDLVQIFAWKDDDVDGFYEPSKGEVSLSPVMTLNEFTKFGFDSANGYDIEAYGIEYMGLTWCAGTMAIDEIWGNITCDGSGNHDVAQSDSFTADLVLTAIQTRNNKSFSCQPSGCEDCPMSGSGCYNSQCTPFGTPTWRLIDEVCVMSGLYEIGTGPYTDNTCTVLQ